MATLATVTSKGQFTIPKQVRDELNLAPGTRLFVSVRNGELVARPKNKKLADLAGFLGRPPTGESLTIEQIDEAIMQAVDEDDQRIMREWREEKN